MHQLIFVIVFSMVGIGICAGAVWSSQVDIAISPGVLGWGAVIVIVLLALNFILSLIFPHSEHEEWTDSMYKDIPGLTVTQVNKWTVRVDAEGRTFYVAPDRAGRMYVQEVNSSGGAIGKHVYMNTGKGGPKEGVAIADFIKMKVNKGL